MNLFVFVFCILWVVFSVSSTGLNEDFTWSRITYQWPDGQLGSRFAYGKGLKHGSSRRPPYGSSGGAIVFEGEINTGSSGNRGPLTNAGNGQISSQKNGNNQENINTNQERVPENIDYQYVNNIPMGANVWQDKLFITVPRRRLGVPSTLNYVPLNSTQRHNVPLIPYPNWDMNLFPDTSGNGENFVSVYRIAIDVCDRMWFVDTGVVETLGNLTVIKPHQLITINLQNDQIINRFTLPENVLTSATILASLTVDTSKDSCGDAYVYFPDLAGYGLVVYSLQQNRAWRVAHNYFYLESTAGEFSIAGHNFQWTDGVFSVELTEPKRDGFRDMYFHSMAGTHMYSVSTRVLRNQTLATRSFHEQDFVIVGDRGPNSQTSTADIHKPSGIMFLGLVNQNALGCWNTNNDLKTISIVQRDDDRMIYPCDVKVYGDKVYLLTNTMPGFLYGRLNYEATNFRVWSNDINSAIKGTKCEGQRRGSYH